MEEGPVLETITGVLQVLEGSRMFFRGMVRLEPIGPDWSVPMGTLALSCIVLGVGAWATWFNWTQL